MPKCFARIDTEHGSRYMQQLCKHFAHKVAVDYDAEKARVELPPGLCMMSAEESCLSFFCESRETSGLLVMQSIIDEHLVKFAWREDIKISWSDGIPVNVPEDVRKAMSER